MAKLKKSDSKKQKDKNGSKGKDRPFETFVALNLLKKSDIVRAQQVNHDYNKNIIHSQISHPFIANFERLAQDSGYIQGFKP